MAKKDFSKYKLNVKRSPFDKRDWKASAIYPKIILPTRTNNVLTMFDVRDQGEQGSCVAMAGAGMKEWQEIKDYGLDQYMSPQFIYNLREDVQEEGMYMRDLMNILKLKGDCFESFYPYGSTGKIFFDVLKNASNFVIQNYAAVESIEELKTALYVNGPCVMAVPVYNFTTRMWYQYSNDYYLGGHAMCVVDYDDGMSAFLIRNSWGDDWGDDGYCWMPYSDFEIAWEFWTTIDAHSYHPTTTVTPTTTPVPEPKKKWSFIKSLLLILGITISIIVILYLIFR